MNKETKKFIDDLRKLFHSHKIFLDVSESYDGEDRYCGNEIEIKSCKFINNKFSIYINDMKELAELIN